MSISFKFYRPPDEETLKGLPIVTEIRLRNTFRSETAWDIIISVYECRVFGHGFFVVVSVIIVCLEGDNKSYIVMKVIL